MKNILAICGSATRNSANLAILESITLLGKSDFEIEILDNLTELPPFKTELTNQNVPEIIADFRMKIANADGIIMGQFKNTTQFGFKGDIKGTARVFSITGNHPDREPERYVEKAQDCY